MNSEAQRRRSVRQAITRKRSRYLDPDTDDDFTISDGQESGSEHAPSPEPAPKKLKHIKRPAKQSRRETRSTARKPTSKKSPPNRKPKIAAKPTKQVAPAAPPIPSDGIIPKWSTLPYEILLQIFSYAFAAELENENGSVANRRVHHPNTWIVRTARGVCRAFAEPALTVFYQSPNLLASRWIDDLSTLVKQPGDQHLFPYQMKVTSLEMSARNLESHTRDSTSSLIDLVSNVPRLSSLVITHPLDEAPYEYQGRLPRWKYPHELFDALDQANVRLDRWRWNAQLVAVTDDRSLSSLTVEMIKVFERPAFQNLRHLTISHLGAKEANESDDDPLEAEFGKKITEFVPNLKTLSFESCDRLSTSMLLQLPRNLESIKFINCMPLNSDMLSEYLASHGHSLKGLVLDHNPWLDLAFLTDLCTMCPQLKILKMDLYDHRENYFRHFGEPKYENLLLEDEVPTWPSTLQMLELVHMQKWGANAAQNLFCSLVESADSLPDLRRLVLQAHINISWRDRAAFRDQWIERLRRVYQRYSKEPDLKLASLKAFRRWRESQAPSAESETRCSLSHVEIPVRKPSVDSQVSDNEPLAMRRSKRVPKPAPPQQPTPLPESKVSRGRRKRGRSDSDAISVASGGDEQDHEDWRNTPERFIQGLCDVVDIRIDNQRPREEQFNESHFLDSEASGDEEWTEGAEIEADEYAW